MKDKILLILTPDYPSEYDHFNGCNALKNQIKYSKDMFKKVIVIAPVLISFGITEQDRFCKNYTYDNVEVYFPRCLFFPRSIKIPYISNYTKVFIDWRLWSTLRTIAKYHLSFDLIHARFTYPSAYIASELKKQYNVPVITSIHEDSGWFEEERGMNHPRFIKAWKSADILTRENTTELKILKYYNNNVEKVTAGFDSLIYYPQNKQLCRIILGLNQDDIILFTFGFLDERKGFQDLIRAISQLPDNYNHIKCYISGSGTYKQKLESLIKQYKLEKNIFIIKRIDDKHISSWINASDLFVFPSLRESFGITQTEALGCGSPVIASNNVGSIDIINSDCGYIYNIGDTYDLSLNIIRGIETKWDRNKIFNYAKSTYSWEIVSKQYDKLYNKLLTT
jgi:teichuronic acid biosynthesis glycosyltransferase TuaC